MVFFGVSMFSHRVLANAQPDLAQAYHREQDLKNAKTSTDSIRILLDVYNLSDKINRDRVRVQIINLTQRSKSKDVLSDVLRELSTTTVDTRELGRLIELSENLPEDTARDNLQTIMIMEKAAADAGTIPDSMVENEMLESLRIGPGMGVADPYKEIQNIYRAMMYLGATSQGPLYFEYIKRLEELVNRLPEQDHAIKNLYYTTAALFYTRKKDYKRAIYYDKLLLKELNKLKSYYKDEGLASHDLDYFIYVSNRRMLRNYRGLTPEEIEEVYQQCVDIASRNEKAAEEFGNGGLTNSYYYMATKQYAKAIPELKKALSQEDISDFRRAELLGHLGYAYRKTGNKEGELVTVREYAQMLLKDRTSMREDMYKEIELRNSVSKIVADEYKAQEKDREANMVMRKTSLTLVYVLAVILIFMCGAYMRLRTKVKELEIRNSKLHHNFEQMFDVGIPSGSTDIKHGKNKLKG